MNKQPRRVEREASQRETGERKTGERETGERETGERSFVASLSPAKSRPSLPLVIVNPASAGGATGKAWPRVASDLRTHFGAFNCAFTEQAGDARLIAGREAGQGRSLIIACGGDGTISEVANGILESGADAELGVLPSGTGGDFKRTLKIPLRAAEAAAALRKGRSLRVDVGRVTFQDRAGQPAHRFFLNVASCGMGGEVIRRVEENSSSWLASATRRAGGGQLSYALASLQTTVSFDKPALRIQLDDHPEFRLVVASLCVANARYFGGGMKIAPEAKLNDGWLDVVAVGDLDTLEILTNVYKLYLGTHLGMQKVRHARARKVRVGAVAANEQVLIEIDGELLGTLPATFEILPRRLRVRCP